MAEELLKELESETRQDSFSPSNDGFNTLVKDLYSRHQPEKVNSINEETLRNINETYKGDYKTFVSDFYSKNKPELSGSLDDEVFANIEKTYRLGQPEAPAEDVMQPEEQPEREKGFWNTYIGDTAEKVAKGAVFGARGLKSASTMPQRIAANVIFKDVENPEARKILANSLFDIWSGGAGSAMDAAQNVEATLQERSDRYQGKNFQDLWKEKKYGSSIGEIFLQASESIPLSLAAMFGGPAGILSIGTAVTGAKYDELDERTDLNQFQQSVNAVLSGGIEAGSEAIFSPAIGRWITNLYKTAGKEVAEETVKKGLKSTFDQLMKKYGLFLAPVEEGIEEMIATMGENITDKITGIDPERDVKEHVFESFVYGFGGGTQFSMATIPAHVANTVKQRQRKREIKSSIQHLLNQTDNQLHIVKDDQGVEMYVLNETEGGLYIVSDAEGNISTKHKNEFTDQEVATVEEVAEITLEIEEADYNQAMQDQQGKDMILENIPDKFEMNGIQYTFDREVGLGEDGSITGYTTDINGNPVSSEIFDQKQVMKIMEDNKNAMIEQQEAQQQEIQEQEAEEVLPATVKIGKKEFLEEVQEDGSILFPDAKKADLKTIEETVDLEKFDVELITEERITPAEREWMKPTREIVTKGIKVTPKQQQSVEVAPSEQNILQQEQAETEQTDNLPRLNDGSLDYESMAPDVMYRELSKEIGEAEAAKEIRSIITASNDQINKLNDKQQKTVKLNDRIKIKKQISELQDKIKNFKAALGTPKFNTVDPATGIEIPVQQPTKTQGDGQNLQIQQEQRRQDQAKAKVQQEQGREAVQQAQRLTPEELAQERKFDRENKKKEAELRKGLLSVSPTSPKAAILQYFISGGKVDPSLIIKEIIGTDRTGEPRSQGDYNAMKWMTKPGAAKTTDQLEHILHGTEFESILEDPTDFRNTLLEVLSLQSPTRMLQELQNEIGTVQGNQKGRDVGLQAEQEQAEYERMILQQAKQEQAEYEANLNSIFEEYQNDNITNEDLTNLFIDYGTENDQGSVRLRDQEGSEGQRVDTARDTEGVAREGEQKETTPEVKNQEKLSKLKPQQSDTQQESESQEGQKFPKIKTSEKIGTDFFTELEQQREVKKVEEASKEVDQSPTEAQKEAGNYKKGHVQIQGMNITIENPKGSTRSGVDKSGKKWSQLMNNAYGYFKRTKGKDGDQVDVFLGDNLLSDKVYVVDQVNKDGSFDEHKVMLGFDNIEQAREAYLSNYEKGWQGLGNITESNMENFKDWLKDGTRTRKPFADQLPDTGKKVKEPWEMTREEFDKSEMYSEEVTGNFTEAQAQALNDDLSSPWIYTKYGGRPKRFKSHKKSVQQALSEGKPVPENVLSEYPDLAQKPVSEAKKVETASEKESPLMKQYNSIKAKHPDTLVLFRVGDFYEVFGEDAIVVSKALGTALTQNKDGLKMTGIAYSALDSSIPKLVKSGNRVAIADPLSDPKKTSSKAEETSVDQNPILSKAKEIFEGAPARRRADFVDLINKTNNIKDLESLHGLAEVKRDQSFPKEINSRIQYLQRHPEKQSGVEEPTQAYQTQINWDTPEVAKRNEAATPDIENYNPVIDNSITMMERILTNRGRLEFAGEAMSGPVTIQSANDIAFLFRNLEKAESENIFVVFMNDAGEYKVLYMSTGTTTGSLIDLKKIPIAAKEFGATQMTFVHNHPSGNLKASNADYAIQERIDKMGETIGVKVLPAIIINLDSGKYSVVNKSRTITETEKQPIQGDVLPVDIYQFDRQKLYAPSSEKTKITQSQDIAEFLSKQKRGITNKMHVIIADRANNINKYMLVDESMINNINGFATMLMNEVGKHGESVFLASNGSLSTRFIRELNQKLEAIDSQIVDVLEIKQDESIIDNYKSFADEMLMEPGAKYDSKVSEADEDIRFRKQSSLGFYSTVENSLDQIKQEKGTPEQFKAMLLKNGAKQAELDWMGWNEFARDINVMTKSDIQNWIDQNKIEVKEVVKIQGKKPDTWFVQLDNGLIFDFKHNPEDHEGAMQKAVEIAYGKTGDENILIETLDVIDNEENEDDTKYSQYQEPGGEKYKEVLLTMPSKGLSNYEKMTNEELGELYEEQVGYNPFNEGESRQSVIEMLRGNEGNKKQDNVFKSSHFDEPNILAHVRFNEREVNGEKVLFLEEVQSDWAQEGKKKGFEGDTTYKINKREATQSEKDRAKKEWDEDVEYLFEAIAPNGKIIVSSFSEDAANRLAKERLANSKSGVPNMPFKQTPQWVNLALRRMIRYAAENGFDKIAWTNGEMQAKRYKEALTKEIKSITPTTKDLEKSNSIKGLTLFVRSTGGNIYFEVDSDAKITYQDNVPDAMGNFVGKELSEAIGKDAAEQAMEATETFETKDIVVRSAGMKAFYDAIVPSAASKLGKPFGAKVEPIQIDVKPNITEEGINLETGDIESAPTDKFSTVQSIPVNEKVKETVLQGVPLFKTSEDVSAFDQTKINELQKLFDNVSKNALSLGRVNIVEKRTDLPKWLQNIMPEERVPGFFDASDGQSYFILNEINSPAEAFRTWVHEVGVHGGLRNIIPAQEFNRLMEKIYDDLGQDEIRGLLPEDYWDDSKAVQGEEYLARLGEKTINQQDLTAKEKNIWQKIVDSVRDILNKLFKNGKFTTQDAEKLVRAAAQSVYQESGQSRDLLLRQSGKDNDTGRSKQSQRPSPKDYPSAFDFAEAVTKWIRENDHARFRFIGEWGAYNTDSHKGTMMLKDKDVAEAMEADNKSPKEIKSATGNQGTFSPSNPDIRFRKEEEELPKSVTIQDNKKILDTLFKDNNINAEFKGMSDTNGMSIYYDINGNKVRFSNHSVLSKNRIENEIHFSLPIIKEAGRNKETKELEFRLIDNRDNILSAIKTDDIRFKKEESESPSLDKKVETLEEKIEMTPRQKETHYNHTLIKGRIRDIKQGWTLGKRDVAKTINDTQKQIIEYAKANMPLDQAGKKEINKLMTLIKFANRPERIEQIFQQIDDIVSGMDKVATLKGIDKMLKDNREKNVKGKKAGNMNPDTYKVLEKIRQIRKMKDETEIENFIEAMDENDPENVSLFATFSDLENKSREEINTAFERLNQMVTEGKMWYKDVHEARQKAFRANTEMTINEMTAEEGVLTEQEYKEKGYKEHRGFINKYIHSNMSFEWLMDAVTATKKANTGQGKLQDYWGDVVHKATMDEIKGKAQWEDFVSENLQKIFGKSKKALAAQLRDNSEEVKKSGVTRVGRNGDRVEMPLSQNTAYKFWQWHQDPTLKPVFEKVMGWDQQTMTELDKFMTPEIKRWAKWQMEEFYPKYYEGVNEKFREAFYANLPFNPFYTPVKRAVSTVTTTEDQMMKKAPMLSGVGNNSLLTRVRNMNELKAMDGDYILSQHIEDMEHFKAWVMPMKEIRSTFNSRQVQHVLQHKYGKGVASIINKQIGDLAGSGKERSGVINKLDKVRRAFVTAELGVNLSLFPKQTVSILTYMSEMPVKDYMEGIAELGFNLQQAAKVLGESVLIKERYKKGWTHEINAALKQAVPSKLAGSESLKNELINAMMFPTRWGDYAGVAGSYAVYRFHYNNSLNELGAEKAHEFAMNKMERAISRSQQSALLKDTGEMQKGSVGKVFTMFKNSQQQYFRWEYSAWRNLINKRGNAMDNAKIIAIYHVLLPVLFQAVTNLFTPDDEDKEKRRLLRAAILGSFNGLLIVADILQLTLDHAMGEKWDYSATPLEGAANNMIRGVGQISTGIKEEDKEKALKGTELFLYGINNLRTGLPYRPTKKLIQKGKDIAQPERVKFEKTEKEYKRIEKGNRKWNESIKKHKEAERHETVFEMLGNSEARTRQKLIQASNRRLTKLKELHKQGRLTDEQYQKAATNEMNIVINNTK
jgi:hypothetical protein